MPRPRSTEFLVFFALQAKKLCCIGASRSRPSTHNRSRFVQPIIIELYVFFALNGFRTDSDFHNRLSNRFAYFFPISCIDRGYK